MVKPLLTAAARSKLWVWANQLNRRHKLWRTKKGEKIAVILSIEEYEKILDELEDLEDMRAFDKAKASGETPIPFAAAIARIERNQK